MNVALLLLSADDCYVKSVNGRDILPKRPSFDKQFLSDMLQGQSVSQEGFAILPPSIKKLVKVGENVFPVTIGEIADADLLIISRSDETLNGKKFRLDNFKMLIKQKDLEIWKRDNNE